MKKRYFTSLFAGMMVFGAAAQTPFTVLKDVTSKLQNADFKADAPVSTTIRTYDYDMQDEGAGAGGTELFGQQPVTGWTAANLTDNTKVSESNSNARTDGVNARAAGIFAYGFDETAGLGGTYYPNVDDGGDTQGLGMVAVWGAALRYTQSVSLPAGDYLLIGKFYNVAGAGTITNLFGFEVDEETAYRSSHTTYDLNVWTEDTVLFRLAADVTGDVVLGYSFGGGSGTAPHLFLDNVKLLKVDPATLDQMQIDEAKEQLLALIEEGKRLHVDTNDAEAVYNNANATLAQVQAAIEAQTALNAEGVTDLSEFFIMNPHFSQDEPITDGICTYDYDMEKNNVTHYGMQPVKSWVASNASQNLIVGDENIQGRASGIFETGSEAFIGGTGFTPPATMSDGSMGKVLGFVTCWSKTTQYTQHVSLPAGSYTLAISFYNAGGTNAVAKNLIGFIAEDGTEYLGETTTFPVGQWGKEVISFTLEEATEGVFSLGYTATNSGSASMPHFFLDGISLVYEGELEFDPSLFALKATVADAENYASQMFYSALQADFQSAIDEAYALVSSQSGDQEANKAAQEKITAMLQDVKASIADYERLEAFYNGELNAAEEKYQSQTDIYNALIALDDDIYDVLQNGDWDTAEIDAAIASMPAIIKEKTQEAWEAAIASGSELDDDLDISPLFDTLGVTYSSNAVQAFDIPDEQWDFGGATNFKTQYGTAEVWSQSPFTISQTLTGMPAGTYTVKTRAFYRTADNSTNYATYDPNAQLAFIFAGNNKTALKNIVEIGSQEEVSGWSDAGGIYVPNSQLAAHNVFEDDILGKQVEVSTRTVLAETGDLTFGVCAEQLEANSWVVWYTFEIAYNAVDEGVMDEELNALIAQANLIIEEDDLGVHYVIDTQKQLVNAVQLGEAALEGDVEAKTAAMSALAAAIKLNDQSMQAVQLYNDRINEYAELINSSDEVWDFASDNNEIIEMVSDAENTYFENNDHVLKALNSLPTALANYVLGRTDFNDASIDNPINITGLIMNYAFNSNARYWTITGTDELGRIGQNQGYQSAVYTNETEGYAVDHFIEAWRPNGALLNDGTIGQSLHATLPAGYYRLECDGFATNQAEIPAEGIQGVGLFAQCGADWDWTSMAIESTSGQPLHFARDFKADGVSPVTVGIRVSATNASWVAADNFCLYYLGTQAPDAISSVSDNAGAATEVYTLQGVKTTATQRGLYIVVKDGKAQKVLKK